MTTPKVINISNFNSQKSGLQNPGVQTNPNRHDYKITNFGGFGSLTVRQTRYLETIPMIRPTPKRLSIFKRIVWRKKFIATIKDQTKKQNIVLGYLHAHQCKHFQIKYS